MDLPKQQQQDEEDVRCRSNSSDTASESCTTQSLSDSTTAAPFSAPTLTGFRDHVPENAAEPAGVDESSSASTDRDSEKKPASEEAVSVPHHMALPIFRHTASFAAAGAAAAQLSATASGKTDVSYRTAAPVPPFGLTRPLSSMDAEPEHRVVSCAGQSSNDSHFAYGGRNHTETTSATGAERGGCGVEDDNHGDAEVALATTGVTAVAVDDQLVYATAVDDKSETNDDYSQLSCTKESTMVCSRKCKLGFLIILCCLALAVFVVTILLGVLLSNDRRNEQHKMEHDVNSDATNDNIGTCMGMREGSILIVAYQVRDLNSVLLLTVDDIPVGATIYLTNNAWNGTRFNDNEGLLRRTFLEKIPARKFLGYINRSGDWDVVSGTFKLNRNGDNIMLYCKDHETGDVVGLSGLLYGDSNWTSLPAENSATELKLSTRESVAFNNGDASIWLRPESRLKFFGNIEAKKNVLLDMWSNELWWGNEFDSKEGEVEDLEKTYLESSSHSSCSDDPHAHKSVLDGTCMGLQGGDVYITSFSVFPKRGGCAVTFRTNVTIPEGATLFMTDDAWTGHGFTLNEGEVGITFPEAVEAGSYFSYPNTPVPWTVHANLNLTTDSNNIIVYCNDDNSSDGLLYKKILIAIIYGPDKWSKETPCTEDSLSEFGTKQSVRPYGVPHVELPPFSSNATGYTFVGSSNKLFTNDNSTQTSKHLPWTPRTYGMSQYWIEESYS